MLEKIGEKDLEGKGVSAQADVPGLSAEEMKESVEEIARIGIKKINEIIEYLAEYGVTREDLDNAQFDAGSVTSVFGRGGMVVAKKGDYTPEMVGAAKEKHADEHSVNGNDPIEPKDIGAANRLHSHGNISSGGTMGTDAGKIVMTGEGGKLEAKDRKESGFLPVPEKITVEGNIDFPLEDGKEYAFDKVTGLKLTFGDIDCFGTVQFGENISAPEVTGYFYTSGDDIAEAKAKELWEFSCKDGRVIWKNWGALNGD